MHKKFKKFRERNPNDALTRDYKSLPKRATIGTADEKYQKILNRFAAVHTTFAKKFVEVEDERDEKTKAEEKLNWLEVCIRYHLGQNDKESYPNVEQWAKVGWIRTRG